MTLVPEIRGSWTIHRGVVEQWSDSQLDSFVREFDQWPELSVEQQSRYPVLSDSEARAKTPFPYVTFEIGDPQRLVGDSGRQSSEDAIEWLYPVAFTVHARTKNDAMSVAREVANRFERKPLCVEPDGWISTEPSGDFSFREGDENWAWRLLYSVRVLATYAINRE